MDMHDDSNDSRQMLINEMVTKIKEMTICLNHMEPTNSELMKVAILKKEINEINKKLSELFQCDK